MIFLLFTIPFVTFLGFVISEKYLFLSINKLTTNDPVVSMTINGQQKLQTLNKLYTITDKKWNYRLKLLFNGTIILYFNIIAIIIYEIIQYEHVDESSGNQMDKDEKLQQVFLVKHCIPFMMQILSFLLSFLFPFIIISLGLKKFSLVKQKNLVFVALTLTLLSYQMIINNVINLKNEEASILLKLAIVGLIFMSSLSAIGCIVTTYNHYFLSKNQVKQQSHKPNYSPKQLFKEIINSPKNSLLYSQLVDLVFLYYCNFKNLLTIFIKIPKNLANLDIIYGLDKITQETGKDNKQTSNPIVVTIVNIINFFFYSQDEKVDQVLMVKVVSILLSFSLFLLCFNYILSFLRNGLNILMYYFSFNQKHNKINFAPQIAPVSNNELPMFNPETVKNSRTELPSHIKNFIFLEFLGIYILATILVILKLFLTKEFEQYLSRYVLNNWITINKQETQSALIKTESESEKTSFLVSCLIWGVNLPQFPLLNKLVMINYEKKANILANVQVLFDLSFEITWGLLILSILSFEIYRFKYSNANEHSIINVIVKGYKKMNLNNPAKIYGNIKRRCGL